MNEININKVSKTYGYENILDNISLDINTNEKIGLIGDNGSGKSTLLKLIVGEENINSGTISIRNNRRIGYLKQIPDKEDDNYTVKDILYRSVKHITSIEENLKKMEEKMQNTSGNELEKILIKYCDLQEKFNNLGGYKLSEKIGKIINGFKLNNIIDSKFNLLSGGEKRIVLLASIMINEPDILLLDEPNNHLDIDTLEWFEKYLCNYNGTVLVISHDRYFLDEVVNKIILLENGKADIYFGNYSYFVEENKLRKALRKAEYKNNQKEIKHMQEQIKQLREWGNLAKNEMFFKRANSIKKRLDKKEAKDKPLEKKEIPINLNINNRSGKDVLIIKDYYLSIGSKDLLKKVNMQIRYGEKVCLLGSNGSGKSTLLKSIIQNNNEHIKQGTNIIMGYIPQEINFANENETVYEYALKTNTWEENILRSALDKYLFRGEKIYKKLKTLSGGEKIRLKLFELIQKKANFILLDEPTNHIDIYTRELLEKALNEFEGTLLFISHDRYFINQVAEKIICIENKKLIEYIGNYEYYKEKYKQ